MSNLRTQPTVAEIDTELREAISYGAVDSPELLDMLDEYLAARDADMWARAESALHEWCLHDDGPGVFNRGLHLLTHLKNGGTLEQYGRPA